MGIKRINLCFDTNEKGQQIVYDYLSKLGRKKTATVVNAILDSLQKTEEANSKIYTSDDLERLIISINNLERRITSFIDSPSTILNSNQHESDIIDTNEIEDIFQVMRSTFVTSLAEKK